MCSVCAFSIAAARLPPSSAYSRSRRPSGVWWVISQRENRRLAVDGSFWPVHPSVRDFDRFAFVANLVCYCWRVAATLTLLLASCCCGNTPKHVVRLFLGGFTFRPPKFLNSRAKRGVGDKEGRAVGAKHGCLRAVYVALISWCTLELGKQPIVKGLHQV